MSHTQERTQRVGTWLLAGEGAVVRHVVVGDIAAGTCASLGDCVVAASTCGGLVAVHKLGERVTELRGGMLQALTPPRYVNTRAADVVVMMTWCDEDDVLLVAYASGGVDAVSAEGEVVASCELPPHCAHFASTPSGFVAVASERGVACVVCVAFASAAQRLSCQRVALTSHASASLVRAVCWLPSSTAACECIVFVEATRDTTSLLQCSFSATSAACRALAVTLDSGVVHCAAASRDGQSVAMLLRSGDVVVTPTSFDTLLRLHTLPHDATLPDTLLWCGHACVAFLSRDATTATDDGGRATSSLYVVGTGEAEAVDSVADVPHDAVLVRECDGVRVLSASRVELLQVVSDEARRAFAVGSTAQAARLCRAYDDFCDGEAHGVLTLRALEADAAALVEAIHDCVACTADEIDVAQQQRLLHVAAFGKSFCPYYNHDSFVDAVRRLRVRHTLHASLLGMAMTGRQLAVLGDEALVRRLQRYGAYALAFAAAEALALRSEDVVHAWAAHKLRALSTTTTTPDAERALAQDVCRTAALCATVSYAKLARLALAASRRHAALVFVEREAVAARQVPMLLAMHEYDAALRHAARACDADVLFTAVVHVLMTCEAATAARAFAAVPDALSTVLCYARACDTPRDVVDALCRLRRDVQLRTLLARYLRDDRDGDAHAHDADALLLHKRTTLQRLLDALPGDKASSSDSNGGVLPRAAQMQTRVLADQERMMRACGHGDDVRFLRASVLDLVRLTLEHRRDDLAQRLRDAYAVPERAWQGSLLAAYATTAQWDRIDALAQRGSGNTASSSSASARTTRCVVPAEAFVETLLAHGQVTRVLPHIARIAAVERRMEYYVQCSAWAAAAADCKAHGEHDMLQQLRERARGDAAVLRDIDEALASTDTPTATATHDDTRAPFARLFR